MTYNEVIQEITEILESHGMIKAVKNVLPSEWLNAESNPEFPVACFAIDSGVLSAGNQQQYTVQFFFLDKSGDERLFERDVISDQLQIAKDIFQKLRSTKREYFVDDSINFNTVSDKYEDYLAGVEITLNITTSSTYDACDIPT